MEELLYKLSNVLQKGVSFEAMLEAEFEEFKKKTEEFCSNTAVDKTPQQNKKRPKHLSPIVDEADDDGGQEIESQANQNCDTNASTTATGSAANSESEESMCLSKINSSNLRPVRTAKTNAAGSLKEKKLNEKMRQPSICKPMQIKLERVSTDSSKSDLENNKNVKNISGLKPSTTNEDKIKQLKEIISKDTTFGSKNNNNNNNNNTTKKKRKSDDDDTNEEIDESKKRSDSVEIVPTPEVRVEISDEESADKMMPPPSMPPPKTKKVRTKQSSAEPGAEEKRPTRSRQIKQEKGEVVQRSTRSKQKPKKLVQEDSDGEEAEIPRPIQVKKEKLSTEKVDDIEVPAKRTTRTKSKDTVLVQVKASKSDGAAREADSESDGGGKKKTAKPKKQQATSPARSEKSVYEDAVSEVGLRPAVVLCQKVVLAATPPPNGDETFLQQPGSANATYNVVNQGNETFDVINAASSSPLNGTFVMEKNNVDANVAAASKSNDKRGQPDGYNESLMTEDNSQDEDDDECLANLKKKPVAVPKSTAGPKSSKNGQNELFNPSHQSPVKRRIEAFEKHAANNVYASPSQARSTRAGGKLTKDTPSKIPSKYNTPNLNVKPKYNSTGPSTSTSTTPTAQSINGLLAAQNLKGISNSTSKLAHIQKKQQVSTSSSSKSHSLSRESSAEDLRKANSTALEEKKKKREEKLRLVHQQKELLEKEKREQAEKQIREREEKYRKMMEEKEQEQAKKKMERKKHEEMKMHNLKVLEQARLEQERLENLRQQEELKRVEREKVEIMKLNAKETQNHLQKQMYQQKLLQQQQKIQQEKQQHKFATPTSSSSYMTKASKPSVFELLNSDDSTDDESNPSKKRPPPPEWSRKPHRGPVIIMQANINPSVIDSFFSVKPMTPDLREIFPAIDQRRLKRNSSAVWRTPPRYSQMPKY